ncbi:MAG: hypothetical protein ACXWDL_04720 [Nocardioides sp.]
MDTMLSARDPSSHRKPRAGGAKPLSLLAAALTVIAVVKELRRPKAERTWQGLVLGFVPYDLRPPTLSRIRASVWQPESERWLLPRSFGVGWSPNLARIVAVLPGRR